MQYLKILLVSLFVSFSLHSIAQKSNSEKILGCWVFKEVQLNKKDNFLEELSKQSEKSEVCFGADGRFVATKATDGSPAITGSFKISIDGKKLVQKRDLSEEGSIDDDAEIAFVDDKLLVFKVEFGKIVFKRK